jgi:hypothetical protein
MLSTATTFRFPEASYQGALLHYRDDVPVLSVGGAPREIGEAVGALAVRPAARMTAYPDDLLRHYRARWMRPYLLWAGEKLLRNLDEDHRTELEAVARSAPVERSRMVLGNTLFDVKKFLACSALLVEPCRRGTGGTLFGRNLDYPPQGYAHEYGLVTVYRPDGKKAFVSIGFPGLVGVLTGMNEDGLALGVLEVFQAKWFTRRLDLGGTPYAVCFRTLLEECSTIDEAKARLEQMRRTTLFNLAVADRQRVAVLEVTPRRVREVKSTDGACVCTNHFRLEANRPLFSFNVYQTFDRERILRRAERSRRTLDVADVHAGLHAANKGDHTLQTMVFEPATLRLHVGLGSLPATAGPLRRLDLEELLRA